ncbi:sigma-70 family RNA polymerase sigma factor [Antribacter sp. KLBMP9083]|uniref:Sigma-70 family RNA polymerase sigma factor n=1 Tax=Antribacter soli TaxID=2910976 RepID=A0AA41QFF1_9MICO|nr:sigma-70 family RNA polymerase sigma factor [Antribacter soli]MCF4122464.1 sigma-70 family RNA polymerase sigma factor [Antribacter soli]
MRTHGDVDGMTVAAAQAGDERARDLLVEAYLPLVYNIVGRALDGHADVDDVVQETMVAMVRGLPGVREPERFRSWLVAVAVNQVRAAGHRRAGAVAGTGDELAEVPDPGADFVGLTILRLGLSGQRRETAEATRWLGPEDQEILSLWWLEAGGRLRRDELADAVGLSPSHAAVRVQRVKEQLETSRTVVRALHTEPRCPGLAESAVGWDGRPSVLWRKRLVRHVRNCTFCHSAAADLVPVEGLLAGVGLVPLPAALGHLVPPQLPAGVVEEAGRSAGHLAQGRPEGSAALRALVGKPVALAVAGGLLVAVGGVVAYAQGVALPDDAATAVASPSAPVAEAVSASPSASADPSMEPSTEPSPSPATIPATLAERLAVSQVELPTALTYLEAGYNNVPEWTRVSVAVAPDGTARAAWPAQDGVHVTPLTGALERSGTDIVVGGSAEVGGLVAHDDGFALLTRVPDDNKWGDTAAVLVRYQGGAEAFAERLTGDSSTDTSPVLDGQLAWNGSRYGAYFVVHGADGWADGHYGDKLVYVDPAGARLSGGWDWGCSHNEGIALHAEESGAFTSLCFDDWRSGLFVSTGISAPDDAPVVQREECWAGYCGGTFPSRSGSLVRSGTGVYATAFASRGATSAGKNAQDTSGRGWTVAPGGDTHQVVVAFLSDGSTPAGDPVRLTSDPGTDHVNVRIAPYGGDRFLVTWETVADAACAAGTCTGRFTGTHLALVDTSGRVLTEEVVEAHVSGDIAVLPDGDLAWAFVTAAPDYGSRLGSSPTTTTLSLARLDLVEG